MGEATRPWPPARFARARRRPALAAGKRRSATLQELRGDSACHWHREHKQRSFYA
jgi:hypothetical protein